MFPGAFGCTTWTIYARPRGAGPTVYPADKGQAAHSSFSRNEQPMVRSHLFGRTVNKSLARSPPISIEDIGSVHFRLKRPGDGARTHLIRADVKMDGATIFVSLNLSDDSWPFLIENDSSHTVTFCQAVSPVAAIRCCRAHYQAGCHSHCFRLGQAVPNLSFTRAYFLSLCMGFPCGD